MNYSMGSGIIRYIKASKTFSKFRAFRSSVRIEVPCASKFRAVTIPYTYIYIYYIYYTYNILCLYINYSLNIV